MAEVIGLKQLTEPNILSMKVDKYLGGVNTPEHVASDMVDIVYKEIENKVDKTWRFLNICCKTGVYLKQLYFRLLNNKNLIQEIPDYFERRAWILKEMLFGICPSDNAKGISSLYLYGFDLSEFEDNLKVATIADKVKDFEKYTEPEIRCMTVSNYDDYDKLCRNKMTLDEFKRNCMRYKISKDLSYDKQIEELKRAFEKENFFREGKKMKFDVVIGNPPYNNDIYLDFVTLGHHLAKECTCMITPAKWQAKGGKKNEDFRKNIVPYISKIVSFDDATNLFNIDMAGGITYYLIGKEEVSKVKIINGKVIEDIPNWIPEMGTNLNYIDIVRKILNHKDINGEIDFRSITNPKDKRFLPQKSYFTGKNFGDVGEDRSSKFYMWSSVRNIPVPEDSFRHIEDMDKYKVYCNHNINNRPSPHILSPNIAAVRESCLMGYGTLDECKSIQSYYCCRLIWYLAYGMKIGNICTEAFKWVPDPGAFDHIFTDQELYEKYNLTPDEINIIESVIKERK